MRNYSERSSSFDISLSNPYACLTNLGDERTKKSSNLSGKPSIAKDPQPDIADDQTRGPSDKGEQTKSFKLKKRKSRSKSDSSDGDGVLRLKLPIRVCMFACIIIWLVICYVKSPLESRYAQMQCQIETLTSSINVLQQGIHPTDEEYQPLMNYEGISKR